MNDSRKLIYRIATDGDAVAMAELINSAYRGDSSRSGWTTEADLVTGERVTVAEIHALIEREECVALLCLSGSEIIGTVELSKDQKEAYLGMFVISPRLQGAGLGKHLLKQAEQFACDHWSVLRMNLSVISVRDELIAFYERRGYRRTGIFEPFPERIGQSSPLVGGLQFEKLCKELI